LIVILFATKRSSGARSSVSIPFRRPVFVAATITADRGTKFSKKKIFALKILRESFSGRNKSTSRGMRIKKLESRRASPYSIGGQNNEA